MLQAFTLGVLFRYICWYIVDGAGKWVFKVALQDETKDMTQLANEQVKRSRSSSLETYVFFKYVEEEYLFLYSVD